MSFDSCNIIMQGDQYSIPIKIKQNGEYIDLETIDTIQFVIGDLVKHYKSNGEGEVIYDNETNEFFFPLVQCETFIMEGPQDIQIRIKYNNGEIRGSAVGTISINYSKTKESI